MHDDDDVIGRYMVVFPDRNTVEEWWRLISDHPQFMSLRRLGQRLLTYDPLFPISSFVPDNALDLLPKNITVKQLNDPPSIWWNEIMSIPLTLWTSQHGDICFIRSKLNPNEYWYCPQRKYQQHKAGTPFYTSTANRTPFQLHHIPLTDDRVSRDYFLTLSGSHLVVTYRYVGGWPELVLGVAGLDTPQPVSAISIRAGVMETAACVCDDLACKCGAGCPVKPLYIAELGQGEPWEIVCEATSSS
ncbi:hypothetical protein BJ138DRAFT_1117731 [Hygrophoropsis aurantiaca]|uniref:Uncharacterized protein n=1 Tax=Hygrophoropsis aurantiaca TaxID=72124 RepID=A0ACB7ZYS6_9AGAM|nr:hypothetical protein BJ138DRAFT_1117731 [Hygrophoropsis aurantiaca]